MSDQSGVSDPQPTPAAEALARALAEIMIIGAISRAVAEVDDA